MYPNNNGFMQNKKNKKTITQVTQKFTCFGFWSMSTCGIKEKVSLTK